MAIPELRADDERWLRERLADDERGQRILATLDPDSDS